MSWNELDVLILAGGQGTRLRGVAPETPKALVRVAGVPFIDLAIGSIRRSFKRLRSIVISAGHLGELLEDHFRNTPIRVVREQEPLGTGGAIAHALPHLTSDPVLILNGDTYFEFDEEALRASFRRAIAADAPGVILVREAPLDSARFGRVAPAGLSPAGSSDEAPAYINAGAYLLRRRTLERIPPSPNFSLERELLPHWLEAGIIGHLLAGKWIDIGTPESLAEAQSFLKDEARATHTRS